MTMPHAYDTITLSYGGNTVALRPSLRAATHLEQLHTGFPNLLTKVAEGDTATLREIITSAATDSTDARNVLNAMANTNLANVQKAAISAAYAVIQAILAPNSDNSAKPTSTTTPAKPVEWADLFKDLYRIATGWLGWTPTQAWAATLIEITEAFEGHTAKLKAINGSVDDEATNTSTPDAAQRKANIEAGLDPDFDRNALNSLKANIRSANQ